MAKLILRSSEELSQEMMNEVADLPGVQILDRSSKMLLVEGERHALTSLSEKYPELQVSEQQSYSLIGPFRFAAKAPPRGDHD